MSSYLGNAVILTGSGLLLRAAGMGLRVYMAGLLGSEGMGLYQLIFTMYGLSIALATSGVSVAAARLTAEQISGPNSATVPSAMALVLGAAAGLGVTACGLQLARFMQNRCAPRSTSGLPQAGQTVGFSTGVSPSPGSPTRPMISGITSLERRIHTGAPMATCLRWMSPQLFSVALRTVTP